MVKLPNTSLFAVCKPIPSRNIFRQYFWFAFIFISLFLPALKLQAQENKLAISVSTGSEIKSNLQLGIKFIIKTFSALDGTVYVCGGGTNSKARDGRFSFNMVEKISRDSVTARSAYISLLLPGEKFLIPAYSFAMLNNKLYAFASTSGKSERTLYGCEVDKITLRTTGSPVKIFTYAFWGSKGMTSDYPEVSSSLGEEKLLFSIIEGSGTNKFGDLHLVVVEQDLRSVWNKKVGSPVNENIEIITPYKIYDNGNVLITGFAGAYYHVTVYSENGESITDRKIDLGLKENCAVLTELLENGRLIVTGSYRDYIDKESIYGIYYMSYEPNETKPSIFKLNELNDDLVPDHMASKAFPIGTLLRSMFVQDDGALTLICERSSGGKLKELLVISLDSDGKAIWKKQVFKSPNGLNEGISAFAAFAYQDNIIIFFNDNSSNSIENSKQVYGYRYKIGVLVACTISSKGEISKQKLFPYSEKQHIAFTKSMIQTGTDEFIFLSHEKKMEGNLNYIHVK